MSGDRRANHVRLNRVTRSALSFYEFFAGGGMARLGLGEGWDCRFANDFDPVKAATYRANFPMPVTSTRATSFG
jgi:site-specific DNA-cytosine methylase